MEISPESNRPRSSLSKETTGLALTRYHPIKHSPLTRVLIAWCISERIDKVSHILFPLIHLNEMIELARKRRPLKSKRKPVPRKKRARPRKVKAQAPPKEVHYRTLLAILMFLYMLRLIDENSFKRVEATLNPKKATKRRRRRRRAR